MGKKCKLSELCDVRDGTHDSPEYVQEGYPLVTSKNIVDGRLDLTVVNYITEKDYNHINERSKVDLGDIIMPMIGTIGNPHLIEAIPEFAIKNVALIKFPKSDVSNKFIYYFLQSDAFKTYVAENNRGGTQKFLSLKDIRNMDIPALPYEKQLEICVVLDKVSELIALRKEQLAKLDQLVKSRFIELFGNLVIGDKVDTNKKKIGEIASVTKLAGFEFTKYIQYKEQGDIIMLRGLNCKKGHLVLDDIKWIDKETSDLLPRSKLYYGDILMTYAGTIGDVAMVDADDKYHLAPNVAKITLNNKKACNPVFLMHLFMYTNDYIMTFASVVAQASINMEKIRNFEYYFPPVEQQNQFAAFVEQTDKSKLAIQQSLDKLELLKKSLMQEYFG